MHRFTPYLETERLVLRPLHDDDAEGIFQLRSDATVNQFLNRQPAKVIDDAIAHIKRIKENEAKQESFFWVITIKASARLIGTAMYYNIHKEEAQAEIGFELLPAYHGKGIMYEALTKIIEEGFGKLGFKTIKACTTPSNKPSSGLLKKLGFMHEETATDDKEGLEFYVKTVQ
jgi:ribosomal-protein-alanine N-acetyltransferase